MHTRITTLARALPTGLSLYEKWNIPLLKGKECSVVLGIKPRVLCVLGKCSTTELQHPSPVSYQRLSSVIPKACSIMGYKGEVYGVSCSDSQKTWRSTFAIFFPRDVYLYPRCNRHYHILMLHSFLFFLWGSWEWWADWKCLGLLTGPGSSDKAERN